MAAFRLKKMIFLLPLALLSGVAYWYSGVEDHAEREEEGVVSVKQQKERAALALENGLKAAKAEPKPTLEEIPEADIAVDDSFTWRVAPDLVLEGKVDSVTEGKQSRAFGVALEGAKGRLVYMEAEGRKRAFVFYEKSELALEFSYSNEEWLVQQVTVSDLICATTRATYPLEKGMGFPKPVENLAEEGPEEGTVVNAPAAFQSKPDAKAVIYCDFDGETVNEADWSASPIVAAPSGMSDADIAQALEIVAEDFAPFDVNVTNVRSVYDAMPVSRRVMCVVTPTDTAAEGAGGVAFLNSFRFDSVCWCFNRGDGQIAGDTISHEVGHTLNLEHDGDLNGASAGDREYYGGHSSSTQDWGPIMGAAFSAKVVQWSKGEYTAATQTQDDLAVMATSGISYRSDDFGDTKAAGHAVTVSDGVVLQSGVISQPTDVDVFLVNFQTYARLALLAEGGATPVRNLDIKLQVLNAAGETVFDLSSDADLDALGSGLLEPGVYEVRVSGDASDTPLGTTATGWTNYGSLGNYTLSFEPDAEYTVEAGIDFNSATTSGGNTPWSFTRSESHDGEDAAVSGAIGNNQTSEFSVTKRTTQVQFWYKTSTESGYDFFEFLIDGVRVERFSGETPWTQYTNNSLSDTEHTFTWRYSKDVSVSSGQDKVWIDEVSLGGDNGYSEWAGDNAASSTGLVDNDGDGVVDLVEYALLGNPQLKNQEALVELNGQGELEIRRDTDRRDLITRIEISSDMENWQAAAVSYSGEPFSVRSGITVSEETEAGSVKKVKFTFDQSTEQKLFMRINVDTK